MDWPPTTPTTLCDSDDDVFDYGTISDVLAGEMNELDLSSRNEWTSEEMMQRRLAGQCDQSPIRFITGHFARSHPVKNTLLPYDDIDDVFSAGEDACFVAPRVIGVADGVGGYSKHRGYTDVMYFSRQLMHHARHAFAEAFRPSRLATYTPSAGRASFDGMSTESGVSSLVTEDDCFNVAEAVNNSGAEELPRAVLQHAYEHIDQSLIGGSTAVLLMVDPTSTSPALLTLNLGDSGFLVLRNDTVVKASEPQTFMFDGPLQLGPRSRKSRFTSADAKCERFAVQAGDLVIAASDGILDNMFHADIAAVVRAALRSRQEEATRNGKAEAGEYNVTAEDLDHAARCIVDRAQEIARNPSARTPYGVEALKFNRGNRGGKMDDCSVVLGLVCTRDEIEGQQYQAQEGEAGDSYVYSASIDDSDYEYTSSTSPLAGAP